MNPNLVAALNTMQANCGAIDRADFHQEHPGIGDALALGLLSHGFAREVKGDRLAMTDAGWRAAEAMGAEE